jgi:hypothetical protein
MFPIYKQQNENSRVFQIDIKHSTLPFLENFQSARNPFLFVNKVSIRHISRFFFVNDNVRYAGNRLQIQHFPCWYFSSSDFAYNFSNIFLINLRIFTAWIDVSTWFTNILLNFDGWSWISFRYVCKLMKFWSKVRPTWCLDEMMEMNWEHGSVSYLSENLLRITAWSNYFWRVNLVIIDSNNKQCLGMSKICFLKKQLKIREKS